MRPTNRLIALSLAGLLSATGCATAHMKGEYAPHYLAKNTEITSTSEKATLAQGNDWVFLWGLLEVASSDFDEDVTNRLRPDVVLTDVEVRNHISLPGTLLWIVTGGLVSHHDLDFRARVASVKEEPRPVERTVIVPGNVTSVPVPSDRLVAVEGELFAETTIDRPLSDVMRDFNDAALRAGLQPISSVAWDSFADKDEFRGEVPRDRLNGVPPSMVKTVTVTTPAMALDATREPRCAACVPGIVLFEREGRTTVLYARPSMKLRELDACGKVGEGRAMNRASFDAHMINAHDFESEVESTIASLRRTPRKS